MFEEKTLKLQTRCHQCIFAQFDKNVQTGCELGRSKEYRKQGKTERKMLDGVDAYEISTACTTYRDDEWLDAPVEEHRTLSLGAGLKTYWCITLWRKVRNNLKSSPGQTALGV